MYGPTVSSARQYTALVNGQEVNGVADNVVSINGQSIAIEAKFVDDWSVSLRNPDSINGSEPWAAAEQQNMVDQAAKYSAAFDQVIYHTNSVDLATYYQKVFEDANIDNFKFIITPSIQAPK
jgi:filamentous hemagglutinin